MAEAVSKKWLFTSMKKGPTENAGFFMYILYNNQEMLEPKEINTFML